eukprot:UN05143
MCIIIITTHYLGCNNATLSTMHI